MSDKIIDLFLEDEHEIKSEPENIREEEGKNIETIWGKMSSSKGLTGLYRSEGEILYNVRYHQSDVRHLSSEKSNLLEWFDMIESLQIEYVNFRLFGNEETIVKILFVIFISMFKKSDISNFLPIIRIAKQIQNIKYPEIKKFLETELEKKKITTF